MNKEITPVEAGFVQRNKWRLMLGVVILSLAALIGWKVYDGRYPSWYEEVRLSDGRIITIHQKHEYFDNYGTNQSWVEIDLPELGGKRVWHSYLMPQRVDVVGGTVYAFGIPRGDRQLEHYRFPKYFMVAFKWSGSEFERIPYLQVPEAARFEENLYPCIPSPLKKRLTISTKDATWCPPRGDKGQLGKTLDINVYTRAADEWATIYRWKNRSE